MSKPLRHNTFATQLGSILATAGCAVGLGNIWRFPTVAGQNGGAAFIFIYMFFNVALGLTCMMTEFIVGRNGACNPFRAYIKAGRNKAWGLMGVMSVICSILILSFYCVVAGWCTYYLYLAIRGGVLGSFAQIQQTFNELTSADGILTCCSLSVLFIVLTHVIVVQGVQKGIEKAAKYMVPLLQVLLILLGIAACSLPNSWSGVEFLFKPDFSKVTAKTFYEAMSMSFFSLSLGTACLVTYASYFHKEANILKSAAQISLIDVIVAILAGVMIFPAAFSAGVQPDAGPSLIFLTLPHVFTTAFSSSAGYAVSILFYALLVLAALTSTISLHEIGTSLISQEMRASRTKAGSIVTVICSLLSILCALSFVYPEIGVMGQTLFNNFDSVTSKLFMPIGALFTSLLVGWVMSRRTVLRQLTSYGRFHWSKGMIGLFYLFIRFVCPIFILIIFVVNLLIR